MRGRVLHIRAETETDALIKVNQQYGSDAIIGETRQVRKPGLAGFLGKKEIEVSVRIKPSESESTEGIEQFRALVSRIGENIRTARNDDYFKGWETALQQMNIGGNLTQKLLSSARDQPFDPEKLADLAVDIVPVKQARARFSAFVGPTGSGKTTTIAKLAGLYCHWKKKKVAIISLDTFRIGAVEQLRTFCEIMGVSLSVASSANELKDLMTKYAKYDRVFIDTTGRAPTNHLAIAKLNSLLQNQEDIDKILVISAITKLEDLRMAQRAFSILGLSGMAVTRVDEAVSLGSVLTFACDTGLPLMYAGTGQSVPRDLQFANSSLISNWFKGATNTERG